VELYLLSHILLYYVDVGTTLQRVVGITSLRMRGAVPPFSHTSSLRRRGYNFTACCGNNEVKNAWSCTSFLTYFFTLHVLSPFSPFPWQTSHICEASQRRQISEFDYFVLVPLELWKFVASIVAMYFEFSFCRRRLCCLCLFALRRRLTCTRLS
jgi:hypothetical protein